MKTAITVLQEMMVKLNHYMPEYECISQTGPHHLVTFEFKCVAEGVTVTAQARSKKEAKQEAARKMLKQLYARGYDVPPPYNTPIVEDLDDLSPPPSPIKKPALEGSGGAPAAATDVRSYVSLLRELCEQYRLGAVVYELTGDTGPAHQRRFVMSARLGEHERIAAAGTKKAARQLAAERLYHYLRENLVTTKDFCEEEALSRALEKAMERYVETREEDVFRPDLSQRVADYHLDEEKRRLVLEALSRAGCSERERAEGAARVMGLRLEDGALPGGVALLTLSSGNPPLVFAGAGPEAAAAAAVRHLRGALCVNDP
ncbi:uncharacterized protein LOC121728974 isoform X2 [Aricia agestis]|uniref:uncharacterized protein LOC121728974 isoform X2 n=1 Tax=Aricia agestis TaxID=91739 RepID=UPI001C2054B1|nr:uncharacterized protein LOC121728974 isoform X2 [Aricia agestis]